VPGARDLADALGQRLAFLAREQVAELGLPREDLAADEVERVEALLRRRGGPLRERRVRRVDRLLRLRARRPARTRRRRRAVSDGLTFLLRASPATQSPAMRFLCSLMLSRS
jgi:hypothetical protein